MTNAMFVPSMTAEEWAGVGISPEGRFQITILAVGDPKNDKNGHQYQRVTFKRAEGSSDEEPIYLNVYSKSASQKALFEAVGIDTEANAGGSIDLKGKVLEAEIFHGKDRDLSGEEVEKAKIRRFYAVGA